jgi:hypothetical protein
MNRTQKQIAAMEQVAAWLADGAPHMTLANGSTLEGFDYETWVRPVPYDDGNTGACGTVACIAGAAVQFDNPLERLIDNPFGNFGRDAQHVDVDREAQEILGLTKDQAELLFYPFSLEEWQLEDMLGAVPAVDGAYDDEGEYEPLACLRSAHPKRIARVLRHFNETGKIDWTLANAEHDE